MVREKKKGSSSQARKKRKRGKTPPSPPQGKALRKQAKREAEHSLRFLFLTFSSLFILFIITSTIPLEWTELFVAQTVLSGLNASGASGQIIGGEPVTIALDSGAGIEISYLCTGLLEMMLLASVVIASVGIPVRKRVIGIAVGIPATMAVNFARIFGTIYFIGNADLGTVEFIHNIFFRTTLFITIFAFYALWFVWATRKNTKK